MAIMDKVSKDNLLLNPELIAEKGEQIYQQKLKKTLVKKYEGQYVAIEVTSGQYVLDKTPEDALLKAKKKYPNRIFHLIKIGYPGVYRVSWSAGTDNYGWLF